VSLLFARGRRPSADAVRALAAANTGFSFSFAPDASGGRGAAEITWLELLTSGLTFDLHGLEPGPAAQFPPRQRDVGLGEEIAPGSVEPVTLSLGPHLTGGVGLVPVLKMLASLAATLSGLEGVRAVAWHSARNWIDPGTYRDSVESWVEGGVFPGLVLASLALSPDRGMHSEGLSLFTGQELRLEPDLAVDLPEAAKLAVRLLDHFVERGKVEAADTIIGPDGAKLQLEPSGNGKFVRVCRA
jgi:hypothetical protein